MNTASFLEEEYEQTSSIETKIQELESELKSINLELSTFNDPFLHKEKQEIIKELETLYRQNSKKQSIST